MELSLNQVEDLMTCQLCNAVLDGGSEILCKEHFKYYHSNFVRVLRDRRRRKGLCPDCGEPATIGKSCERHWFEYRAKRAMGSRKNWVELKTLLIKQAYRCAYTGELLIPGENASVDHILPVKRGGTNHIENLQWVTEMVNFEKSTMTHTEYLEYRKQDHHPVERLTEEIVEF